MTIWNKTSTHRLARQLLCWKQQRCFLSSSSAIASSKEPRCSQALGRALPTDEHACSVSLPTWASVVGYEEGDAGVTQQLSTGYPRFVYHPYIVQLMEGIVKLYGDQSKEEDCLVLPTRAAAERCRAFLQQGLKQGGSNSLDNAHIHGKLVQRQPESSSCRIVELPHVSAVLFPAQTKYAVAAKAYWQHTGEIVSSRRAEMALTNDLQSPIQKYVTECRSAYHPSNVMSSTNTTSLEKEKTVTLATSETTTNYDTALRQRIAEWTGCLDDTDNVFLAPSGMGGIYAALRAARRCQMKQHTIAGASMVFGFPYLDTLKLCSRTEVCPDGVEFFGHGDAKDLQQLETLLERKRTKYCALFTEIPSNPLLQSPDLVELKRLADKYNFYLIVDDTIGNFLNVNVLSNGIADAVCTSLTKLVSGRGDAIAGSIITNPFTERGKALRDDLQQYHDPSALYSADAQAIYHNSNDFVQRNSKINDTSERFVQWLEESQPDVAKVYYPKNSANYAAVMREGAGYGGLVSILLHPHVCQRTFFDALDVPKGPSLGTNFTLVCPYTLLAHYHELDFAMSYDVPPNLLRIAVGLEPFEELQDKFERAFRCSRLYPKLTKSKSDVEHLPQ